MRNVWTTIVPIVILCVNLMPAAAAYGGTIPHSDFLSLTENALRSLDELEAVIRQGETTGEKLGAAGTRFSETLRKYDAYVGPEGVFEKEQGAITLHLILIEGICRFSERLSPDDVDLIMDHSKKARDLFAKYREDHT